MSLPNYPDSAIADGVWMRPLHSDDLDAAHALSVQVKWPHRPMDWHNAASIGEGFVALQGDRLVGTAMRWTWGAEDASIGMFIVAEEARGRHLGSGMMERLLAGLEGRTIRLHARREAATFFERFGFVDRGSIVIHQGKAAPASLLGFQPGERLRPAGRNDRARLIALDAKAHGYPRDNVIRMLWDQGEVVVLDRDMEAVGFAFMRRFGRGLMIGPVIAPDLHGAQVLIAHFMHLAAGRVVRIELPADCELHGWLDSLGAEQSYDVVRMTRGTAAEPGALRVFALASQSVG